METLNLSDTLFPSMDCCIEISGSKPQKTHSYLSTCISRRSLNYWPFSPDEIIFSLDCYVSFSPTYVSCSSSLLRCSPLQIVLLPNHLSSSPYFCCLLFFNGDHPFSFLFSNFIGSLLPIYGRCRFQCFVVSLYQSFVQLIWVVDSCFGSRCYLLWAVVPFLSQGPLLWNFEPFHCQFSPSILV